MAYFIIDLFAKFSYELMWVFSYVEIMVTRIYNHTILPIKQSSLFKSIKGMVGDDATIYFVKNGDVIHKSNKEDTYWFKEDFDFLVDTSKYHQVLHKCLPNDFEDYTLSSVEFIMSELCIGNEKLQIKFTNKHDHYTYAIVDNVINTNFLMYFIRKHYHDKFCDKFNIPVTQLVDGYALKIMDNNVNTITIRENQTLSYLKDSYVITEMETQTQPQQQTETLQVCLEHLSDD
jgi:hypothetical protein